jgi:phosphoesterase RecJ-like protein
MTPNWPRFAEIVRSQQRFLLTSHVRPDCDALGSELGMAGVLRAIGKDVTIVNGQATPPNIAFIDPQREIKALGVDVKAEALTGAFDVLMILDTSAWAQLGPMSDVIRASTARKLLVDHHVGEDELGAEPFKNTTAEATGRLVMEAAEALGVTLTPEIATPLFAAIATDTGWFRFGSASAGTYRLAAKLIDAGATPAEIFAVLYEQDTAARVKLRGVILSKVVTELDGRLAHTHVLKDDFAKTGALPSDTEDVINMALAIAGTEVAVIFVEQAAGGFKISFRSRSQLDCNEIARTFGGGGHKAAAGAFVAGDYATASRQVLDVVRAAMR